MLKFCPIWMRGMRISNEFNLGATLPTGSKSKFDICFVLGHNQKQRCMPRIVGDIEHSNV